MDEYMAISGVGYVPHRKLRSIAVLSQEQCICTQLDEHPHIVNIIYKYELPFFIR